ncbi:acetyltransferase [uncultured Flavobacterium sp.]|jgi:sugar O-acyltransferase (sialic acid O-acetyltransferase NeuD family)|uniref:acetyltransferase n=1 Tax=uncultured Flavobacterium sp. TaxID=165435 RepID=UPI002595DAA3|nr:acetyltransferase [uncultured Flavobacterium sp.]
MIKTNSNILIFGMGGHAKSVIRIIEAEAKWNIYGLLDDEEYERNSIDILGYQLVGFRNNLLEFIQLDIKNAFVAIGNNQDRARITNDLISKGFSIESIIHPNASVLNNAPIGYGTMIHAQAIIGPDAIIGKGTIISAFSGVGHDSIIGDYAHLTPGVLVGGGAVIGDFSFLGMGAVVLPGVKIGKNVQVGANSVIHKDLEDNIIVAGNPARIIKRIFEE